jgi:mono/diheme cytochrome c family protein
MRSYQFVVHSCIVCALFLFSQFVVADGWDPGSQATTIGSISNTRHNLTVNYSSYEVNMNAYRNNYGEVCVYCHTPHGANRLIAAPLWNRTVNTSQYTIYDQPRTLNQPITQPGPNSLTCLSCHDGTISSDSVVNMPGSGGYNTIQETATNQAWLDTWVIEGKGAGPGPGNNGHFFLTSPPGPTSCLACHTPGNFFNAPDFTIFVIGTDLTNDHPIGIEYPTNFQGVVDFNQPSTSPNGNMTYFDTNGDGNVDTDEVRLYNSDGATFEVECASCHDPHGVPSGGSGTNTRFNPSFLRVNNGVQDSSAGTAGITSNTGSALCLTCHVK